MPTSLFSFQLKTPQQEYEKNAYLIIFKIKLTFFNFLYFVEQLLIKESYDLMLQNYDFSSRGEITPIKSSSFLRGPRVPIILLAFGLS